MNEKKVSRWPYVKEWRARKLAEDPDYRKRTEGEGARLRAWDKYRENPEEARKLGRESYANASPAAAEKRRAYDAARRAPGAPGHRKHLAGQALRRAIKRGVIVRPDICSKCGTRGVIYGHHTDYSRPFHVTWLCGRCHKETHDAT